MIKNIAYGLLICEIFAIGSFFVGWSLLFRSSHDSVINSQEIARNLRNRVAQEELGQSGSISLVFGGDIMLSRAVGDTLKTQEAMAEVFKNAKDFFTQADITVANLEGPMSGRGKNQGSAYSFNADPSTVQVLIEGGFDVVSLANNHMLDWGPLALTDTVQVLNGMSIGHAGAGATYEEANAPALVKRNGLSIAFFSYTTLYPRSYEATDNKAGISNFDLGKALERIQEAKKNGADLVVVLMHWGEEYQKHSNTSQQALGRALIDGGADMVVGHHPHVMQEVEVYKGRIIVYSLGNLIFDQPFSQDTMQGLVMRVKAGKKKIQEPEFFLSSLDKSYRIKELTPFSPEMTRVEN